MSSSSTNRRGGGLILSPRAISGHARYSVRNLRTAPDKSYLTGLHVGDDQGRWSGCTFWSGIKIDTMHFGNKVDVPDMDCLMAYESACRWFGQGDIGFTFEQAFEGLRREGYLKWAKGIEQVYDFAAMEEGPLWYGMQVTSGIQDADANGCPNYALPIDDLGLHATVLGAVGIVERYQKVMLTIVGSWGIEYGYKGLIMLDELMHREIGFAMYRLIPK